MRRMDVEDEITLGMLRAIESNCHVSQRKLSERLGIALGLTNAYLRRCVRKGLVKIKQAPMRRYAYYLTPQGFAEKSRLTAEYLTISLDFFRMARRECTTLFTYLNKARWRRLALAGAGELAEVAVLSANDVGVEIVAIIDPLQAGQRCAGRPVISDLGKVADQIDAVVVTAVRDPQRQFEAIKARMKALGMSGDRLIVLDVLQLRPE